MKLMDALLYLFMYWKNTAHEKGAVQAYLNDYDGDHSGRFVIGCECRKNHRLQQGMPSKFLEKWKDHANNFHDIAESHAYSRDFKNLAQMKCVWGLYEYTRNTAQVAQACFWGQQSAQ